MAYELTAQAAAELYNGSVLSAMRGHVDITSVETLPWLLENCDPADLADAEQALATVPMLPAVYQWQGYSENLNVEAVLGLWAEHLGLI